MGRRPRREDDDIEDLLPRRFVGWKLGLSAVLMIGAGLTYVGTRRDAEPTATTSEPAAWEEAEALEARTKAREDEGSGRASGESPPPQTGLLGMIQQESGHFLASPYGQAYAVGNDDEDVWGGLTGTEIGEAYGTGGLGIVGNGRGGGGTGEGTIGLGTTGLIGHGGGGGTGSGYGRGSGAGFGGRGHRVPRVRMGEPSIGATAAEPTQNEDYDPIDEHDFVATSDDRRSTFSIDVDTASYSNVRRFLEHDQLPPADAVRIEELVNYFDYGDDPPAADVPFAVHSEVAACPWADGHLLVRLGLKGQVYDHGDLPTRNFVFLVDVSGSMDAPDRLPLLRQSLGMLVDHLRPQDRVGIVVYAGASGVVLEPTRGDDKKAIRRALERLQGGGSTNGGAGIELAYRLASKHFVAGGSNRVILATDGDFNVGVTSKKSLVKLIEQKRESGVFLSVLGVGRGNLQDATMERLADKGNGNYAYIDSIAEAKKVLVDRAAGTLVTIAKDVKIQVEFDDTEVASWRLLGYENRRLAHADFADDSKDAGEIGAGHGVTALYEIVPRGVAGERSGALMRVALRYKQPDGDTSTPISHVVGADARSLAASSEDFRFAAAVTQFGMLLRNSGHRHDATWASTIALAEQARGDDATCMRAEFVDLVGRAAKLAGAEARPSARPACKS